MSATWRKFCRYCTQSPTMRSSREIQIAVARGVNNGGQDGREVHGGLGSEPFCRANINLHCFVLH